MESGSRTSAELTVLAFVQTLFGSGFLMPLRESGAPWSLGYASLAVATSLIGVVLLWFALRNGVRLWRLPRGTASGRTLVALGGLALAGALVFSGPLSSGVWVWRLVPLAVVAAFFLLVLVLEARARVAGRERLA